MRISYGFLGLLVVWVIAAQGCMFFRMSDSDAANEFKASNINFKTGNIAVGNRNMHYAMSGVDTMPMLVFIHGSPGSWDAFKIYMMDSMLLQKYCMVSIDRPGFGYSDFGKALNMKEQTTLLNTALQKIHNGKPVILAGHSLGGPAIVKMAATIKDVQIKNVVLIAGSVSPEAEAPERWRSVFDYSPLRYLLPGAFRPSNTEIVYFKKDVYELQDNFKAIHCPVLILHGDKDDFVPPANATYAKEQLENSPSVRIVWYKDERHFIPWTRFKEIRDELLQLSTSKL